LKLIESKRVLFSKLKNNSKKVIFLEFEKNKIVNKIDKSSLLLEFLIQFENEITSCCCCNIVTKSSSSLAFIESRNLLIVFVALDCVNRIVNK